MIRVWTPAGFSLKHVIIGAIAGSALLYFSLALSANAFFFVLGFLVSVSFLLIALVLRNGLVIRWRRYVIHDIIHDVQDTILPLKLSSSSRAIYHPNQRVYSTIVPLWINRPIKYWPYLDVVHKLLQLVPSRPSRCLVLGVGGGSLIKLLIEMYPDTQVDGVEISREMLQIASTYFIDRTSNITLHEADAIDYMSHIGHTYDIVIVDLFSGDKLIKELLEESFIHKIIASLNKEGLLIINAGFEVSRYKTLFRKWSRLAPLSAYKHGRNYILSTCHILDDSDVERVVINKEHALNTLRNLEVMKAIPESFEVRAQVLTTSMLPTFRPGDVVRIKKVPFEEIRVQDIVAFRLPGIQYPVIHRVVTADSSNKQLRTKGDNNDLMDKKIISPKNYLGKVVTD